MSTNEVCAFLNISYGTLTRMCLRGDITPIPGNPMLRKQPIHYREEDVARLQANPPKNKPPHATT